MEIPSTRFDATDPFAQAKLQMRQAETVLRQLPAAQQEQVLAEVLPPIPVQRAAPGIESAVTMVTVKVDDWDGGPVPKAATPMMYRRPRRIVGHIPWQWVWIVNGIRFGRRVRRSAAKQLRLTLKASRRFLRRVLPRHQPMRGARAR